MAAAWTASRSLVSLVQGVALATALVVTTPSPAPLAAQEGGTFTLFGRVFDGETQGPVAYARVRLEELDRTVVADSMGVFLVQDLRAGTYTFETERIGYRANREASTVVEGNVLLVRLEPLAVELEGLEVVAPRSEIDARLDRRIAAYGFRGTVAEREDLALTTAPTVADFIGQEAHAYLTRCPSSDDLMSLECLMVRGRARRVTVYVDDMRHPGDGGILHLYYPQDLYRVEVLPALGQVRIYTRHYVEWMLRTGRRAPPICIVCG